MKMGKKFFTWLFALLITSGACLAQNEIYDFETFQQYDGATAVMGGDYSGITGGQYLTSITTTNNGTMTIEHNRLAFNPTWNAPGINLGENKSNHGLRTYGNTGKPVYLAICNCWNGDRVRITYERNNGSYLKFVNAEGAKVNGTFVEADQALDNMVEFTCTNPTGDILLKSENLYLIIKKIEVFYQSGTPAVSFNNPTNKLSVGQTARVQPTVTPSTSTPTFSSSDPSVATINKYGDITAVSHGTTTITATVTVGNNSATASYELTVETNMASFDFDFTGSGGDYSFDVKDYPSKNHGTCSKIIISDNRTYGNKTFNNVELFAFPQGETGIILTDDGIKNNTSINKDFYIVGAWNYSAGAHNGDLITVYYTGGTITATSKNLNTERKKIDNDITLTSGTTYYATADGDVVLSIPPNVTIQRILIQHDWGEPSFRWTDSNLSSKFDTSNGVKLLRYNLATLDFTEPLAVTVPSLATYTVRSLNENVAKMSTTDPNDILFINTGTVTIEGTMKTNDTELHDYYNVEVWANPGNYTELGKTCKMSEIGMLNADRKTVTAISGITMEFGNPEDATLIVEDPTAANTNHLVAYTINMVNGWRHKYPYSSGVPTNGTFYKFTTQASGSFSFKGIKDGNTNTVVLVDASNMSQPILTIDQNISGYFESATVSLTAGHTYYLYGNVPEIENSSTGWTAFLLSEFTYESTFVLRGKGGNEVFYGAISSGVTSATDIISIEGVTNPQIQIVGYAGDVSNAVFSVSNEKKLQLNSFSGTGGAVRLKISDGSAEKFFTLTIPYAVPEHGKHVWDFRLDNTNSYTQDLVNYLKNNVNNSNLELSGLTRTYKVSSKNNSGGWTDLIDPIIAVNGRVMGDNGFYYNKSAGLIFEARSAGFGLKESACKFWTVTDNSTQSISYYSSNESIPSNFINNGSYTIAEVNKELSGANYDFDDEAEYRMTYEVTTKADYLMLKGESSIVFPGVKGGQYIKLFTYRHSDEKGETYYAKNLQDLDGNTYDGSSHKFAYHGVLNGSNQGGIDNCFGGIIFKVPDGYSNPDNIVANMPAITMSDDGWARIYKIEVCDDYSTDMLMSLNRGDYPEFIDVTPDCEHASIVVKDGVPVVQEYSGVCTQILVENAGTCQFSFEVVDGTVDYEVEYKKDRTYNLADVTYKGGRGVLKVTQKEVLGDFTVDMKDFYIAVSELHSKTYPYTWDFTNYNMFAGSSTTQTSLAGATTAKYGKWNDDKGTYGLDYKTEVGLQDVTTTKPLFAQGSELCSSSASAITPIIETEGLGLSATYTTNTVTRKTGGVSYDYQYKSFNINNNSSPISIDGNKLTGAGEVIIPNVDNNMYIFVQATSEPTVTAADGATLAKRTQASNDDPFSIKSGVYLYANVTGTKQDVTLSFDASAQIDFIGVTNIAKQLDKFGYATESRDRAIDHTYEGKLTDNDVNAYIITTEDGYGTTYNYKGYPMVKKTHVEDDIVPANTGIVLCKDNYSGTPFFSPFFVPAVNKMPAYDAASSDFWQSNWMIPNVQSKLHSSEVTNRNEEASADVSTLPYYSQGVLSDPEKNYNSSNSTIFGSVHSDPIRFVDLNGYKELRIYQTAGDPVRCFFYNRDGSDHVTINTTSNPRLVQKEGYYSLDLNSVYQQYGQVKLIGVKASAHDATATVSEIKVVSYGNSDDTECTKFIMAPSYYTYYKKTDTSSELTQKDTEAFFRMRLATGADAALYNTLGANKACLLIPSAKLPTALWNAGSTSGARQGVIYMDLSDIEDDELTGVNAPLAEGAENDHEPQVYYTLSGIKIDGKPTTKGIYICNGKKVNIQ